MWFGNVGVNKWEFEPSGACGKIVRTVEAGVRYSAMLPTSELAGWVSVRSGPDERDRFEFRNLHPSIGQRKSPETLFELAEKIRPRRGKMDPDDPLLDKLDEVIGQLLGTMEKLHAKKQPLGMVHPLNVVWFTNAANKTIFALPDTGFAWSNAGARPDWLADPAELQASGRIPKVSEKAHELEFRKAWYPDPVKAHHGFDPPRDIAAVARLLDWVVTGEINPVIPEEIGSRNYPAYEVLLSATKKGIKSAKELRERLLTGKVPAPGRPAATKIGAIFVKPPPPPATRRSGWVGLLLALLLLAGGVGAGIWFWPREVGVALPDVPSLSPSVPPQSALVPLLSELERILDAPPATKIAAVKEWVPKMLDIVERTNAVLEGDKKLRYRKGIEAEEESRATIWTHAKESLDKTLNGLLDEIADRGMPLKSVVELLKKADDEYETLHRLAHTEKEKEWKPQAVIDIRNHLKLLAQGAVTRRFVGVLVGGTLLATVLAVMGGAFAQDPAVPGASSRKVVFGLRTDPKVQESTLESLLKQAQDYASEDWDKDRSKPKVEWTKTPKFRRITPEMFQVLERIARGDLSDLDGSATAAGNSMSITPFAGNRVWMLDLGSPRRSLVQIDFLDAAGKPMPMMKSASTKDADSRLDFATLGKYRLSQEFTGAKPAKYKVTYTEGENQREEVRDWPADSDCFWLVELANFGGNLDQLFAILRERTFSTPIRQLLAADSTTLVLADLKTDAGTLESGWSGNNFVFRFPLVRYPGKDAPAAKKMFVQFPLTKGKAKDLAEKLNKMKDVEVIPWIREQMKSDPKEIALTANAGERWYELDAGLGKFERSVAVEDPAAWQLQAQNGGPDGARNWRVSVYMLDRGLAANGTEYPFTVTHPVTKESVHAVDEEEPSWLPGIRKLKAAPAKN